MLTTKKIIQEYMKQQESFGEEFLEHHMHDDFADDLYDYFDNFLNRAKTLNALKVLCEYTGQECPTEFNDEAAMDVRDNCRIIFGSEVETEFDEIIRQEKSGLRLDPRILGFSD